MIELAWLCLLLLGLGLVSGGIADRKGRSFWGFFLLGVLLPVVGIIGALIVSPAAEAPTPKTGDIVTVQTMSPMENGTTVPVGHASKVLDVDDGIPVGLITSPSGTKCWVDRWTLRVS